VIARLRRRSSQFTAIWVATVVLFAVSPLLAPGSLGGSALLSMLPFAAILAIAAIGQTLVIQQRGLDLSVPGMITLTTIIVTKVPNGAGSKLPEAIGLVVLACVISGTISGLAITQFGITPLVATLGTGALLQGAVLQITSGVANVSTPPGLARFALAKSAGVPNTLWIAVVVLVLVTGVIRFSVLGRRFVAVGASPPAARAAGIPVRRYEVLTYIAAALAYGGAGILAAGYLQTPGIDTGDNYLLPTIAAVVLGGTSLAGGNGSVIATAVGALFLTQLEQVVLGMGAPNAVQLIIQGSIIAVGMAARTAPWHRLPLARGRLADGATLPQRQNQPAAAVRADLGEVRDS
jgi:ribose transport system permease protein